MDAKPLHVGNDQKRGVLQRNRITLKLRIEVPAFAFVFPSEAPALPHIGPAVAAAGLERALLEGIPSALGIGLARRGLIQHAAEVDELRLRCRAFGQLDILPLGDEFVWRHGFGLRQGRRAYWLAVTLPAT